VTDEEKLCQRQRKTKKATSSCTRTFSPNVTAVSLDEMLGDGQANATAAAGSAAGFVNPVKTGEKMGQIFSRDADASIADGDKQFLASLLGLGGNFCFCLSYC
jgi:hypothetical protein